MLNTNVTASAADTLARVPNGATRLPVQVNIGAGITASVVLSGRTAPDAPWVQMATVSASGTTQLDFVPYLKVDVTISQGGGGSNTVQVTAPYSAERITKGGSAYAAVPIGVTRPTITGKPELNETLTGNDGAYLNDPTAFDRQWLRRGLAILGATSSTYALTLADVGAEISYEVTPRNAAGAGRTWRSRRTDGVRGPNSTVMVPDHVNTWNPKGNKGNTPTPTPTQGATPLVDPVMFVIGASLEALSYRGTQSPYSYGYSAQGPINLLNMFSPKRLFTVQMGVSRGSFPWYSRPSASASGSASFTVAGNSGPSINTQVTEAITAIRALPAGKQAVVYYSGSRNGLEGSSVWMPKEMANIDKLLAEPRVALVLVPGLWKRDTASGGDWASGGADRARVDAINAKYPAEIAARGPRVAFMPLQDTMIDPASADGNPKPGYSNDLIHYATKGSQAAEKAERPIAVPFFAGVERKSGTNLLATEGTAGTLSNGVTGVIPTGYSATKDPTISAAVSVPSAGKITVAVTRAEAQATAAEGVTLTSNKVLDTAGGKFRGLVKVTVPPTPLPISLAAYLVDTSAGANQRTYALYPNHATTAGGVFTQTATAAIDPWDASEGLTLWLETMQDMDVAPAADASMAMVFATSVNQGPVATYTVEVEDWWVTKVAAAPATSTPTPNPTPTPAPTSYKQLTGAGWFDASQTSGDNQPVTTLANRRAGKGDLTRVGTGGSITSVPNIRNNRAGLRLVRDVSAPAATPHLAAASAAAISSMWVGDDRPFFAMFAYMPTDANTGPLWGAALDSGTNLDHVAQYRRSGTASTIRKKSGSASQIDVPTSVSAGDLSGTPVITAVLHDGKTVTTWSNSTTPTTVSGAQDVAAISGPQVFRLFAHKVNGNILNAQCNLDFYEAVFEEVSIPTPQQVASYLVEMAGDWAIPLS